MSRLRGIALRALTAAGYGLIALGAAVLHRGAGLVVAGILLALWAWQALGDGQ